MSHAAAMNTIASPTARYAIGPDDRTLLVSALDFDLSVFDLFAPLSAGGAVVPLDEGARRDAARWCELVDAHGVTMWNTVPVLLDMLLAAAPGCLSSLRLVLVGGDRVSPQLPGRLHALAPGCRFLALGGMTEAAIHSTVLEVPAGATPDPAWACVPWGVPLDNVRCRVVDARGRDRPDGVTGELWVGGASVARGYRGDAERTADRFVAAEGTRWYRSGDLARYLPDGTCEFLGRADHQVKVRGHRIELGEIEAALDAHPDVSRAVAVVLDGGPAPRLAAAVVRNPDAERDALLAALPGWQAERLPAAMVCDTLVVLDSLPLTANGKPDRAAVARLLADTTGPRSEPPRGALLLLQIGVDRPWTVAVPGFVLIGLGSGLAFPPLLATAVGVVSPDRAGMASGMANNFFPVVTAVGVAVFGALSTAAVDAAGLTGPARDAAAAGRFDQLPAQLLEPARYALVDGLHLIAVSMATLSALAAVIALATIRERDRARSAGH